MNKLTILLFALAALFLHPLQGHAMKGPAPGDVTPGQDSLTPLYHYLTGIPGIGIEKLQCLEPFTEKYLLNIPQPVDHHDPDGGSFTQRVFVMYRDKDAPVVFTTEGYYGEYATYPFYQNELDFFLGANEVLAEHRYFGPSAPEPLDWQYLTVEQAAADHHRIVGLLKPFFTGKWVSTGISKGGQTAIYHRAFWPDDVDATVAYVCPLNFSIEEQRCYDFLDWVGSDTCRQRIHEFQEMLLCNREKYFTAFLDAVEKDSLRFSIGDTAGYELSVLEYSFAFWQWGGTPCDSIPGPDASPARAIRHLDRVTSLDWVSDQGIAGMLPFFYQALTEIGFYGYDHSEFEGCIEALSDQTFRFTCPEGVDCVYDPLPMEKVDNFVRHYGQNMIFIYGEWDPWSAPAVQTTGKTNSFTVFKPGGNHGTRIFNLPEEQREKILVTLEKWLDCKTYRQ